MLDAKKLGKAIAKYRDEIAKARGQGAIDEGQLSHAFANLLRAAAPMVGWDMLEQTAPDAGPAARFDGILRKNFLTRGVWEAKDTKDNLRAEIVKKIARGYPLTNILFEDTRQAILYQDGRESRPDSFDLGDDAQLAGLLGRFLGHTDPQHERFDRAVVGFGERVRTLCDDLKRLIARARDKNKTFREAFATFTDLCQASINPGLDADAIDNLLIQHLLIQRLIEKIFVSDFFQKNAIAREIEAVITTLTGSGFDREAFYADLNPFYEAIEGAAATIGHGPEAWTHKQGLLNDVYERFFQKYDPDVADTHGIVYTPQVIVDFMCASVEEVLRTEFDLSLGHPDVQILDPCTGTGNFVVNLLKRIPKESLADAYRGRLFANEIQLLPYYIAALNIEHAYYELMGKYEPFPGLCFVDTLELAEPKQPEFNFMSPENTDRVDHQQAAKITVIVGNPPYNFGQKSENDNNKNRKYPVIDQRVRETYSKDSKAKLKNSLFDPYIKFFRWASDRLDRRNGVVCFVTNNAFFFKHTFDGMRKHLLKDFDTILHIDLRGNVVQNPELSGTAYNVFGITLGVGITIAVRQRDKDKKGLWFYQEPLDFRRKAKLEDLSKHRSISGIPWVQLMPDHNSNWIIYKNMAEFSRFVAIGDREIKSFDSNSSELIFNTYCRGVGTCRDEVIYDFNKLMLCNRIIDFINNFNYEVFRLSKVKAEDLDIDKFVDYSKIKWDGTLKSHLGRRLEIAFEPSAVRYAHYRPFTKKQLYFESKLINRVYLFKHFFPNNDFINYSISVSDIAYRAPGFSTLVSNQIVDLHLLASSDSHQCFPFYTWNKDGVNRRENITDWALSHFRSHYGPSLLPEQAVPATEEEVARWSAGVSDGAAVERAVAKWDIFHYVYAVLHHPTYRERYGEVLKKELPRVPLLPEFGQFVRIGRALAGWHVHYEHVRPYEGLAFRWTEGMPVDWRVERMKLSKDKTELRVNDALSLAGIPPEVSRYRLGNRSALEWIVDQYRVDPRTGEDPNREDDPEYIVRLVRQVIAVSLATVALVDSLPPWPESPTATAEVAS